MNRQNLIPLVKSGFWHYFAVVGLLTVAYFVTAQLAFSTLGLKVEASPVWPPAGIALAALLLQGKRVWPGVALGAFFFALSLKVSWTIACGSALGSVLQALVGAELLRSVKFQPSLKRLQDVLHLVIFGAWGSTIVGATVHTLIAYFDGLIDYSNLPMNWWTLWLGDWMGILVFTPLLLLIQNCLQIQRIKFLIIKKKSIHGFFNTIEIFICFSLLSASSWAVFYSKIIWGIAQYPLEYLPFAFVVWAALRYAQTGAIIATLIVSLIAIWGTVQGAGPFVVKAFDINQAMRFLQCFLGVVTITALLLAASESEREEAVNLLKEQEASLANAQRLAQIGNWDFYETCPTNSCSQKQLRWSDELYRIFGFTPKAFKPNWEAFLQVVHPEDQERVRNAIQGAIQENKPYCLDYRILLPNNSERVVSEQAEIYKGGISGTVQDITERKQVEAQLRLSAARGRLLGEMALRIRRSLNLEQILKTTVAEVRQFLISDRVFIAKFDEIFQEDSNLNTLSPVTYWQGQIIAESVDKFYPSLRSLIIQDQSTLKDWRSLFEQGGVRVVEDTTNISVSPQLAAYYSEYQIKAILGVPIFVGEKLYGALVVNQCEKPRQWLEWEIDWLASLATQVAIAIQQAELYRQITDLNTHLECQVKERTQDLSTKMTELQELNQLKDVFLQAVSHDLRTSLLGMSMVLNNLYNSAGENVTLSRSLLKRMISSSDRQLNLINSLLEDHFHEQRQLELNRIPVKLDKLIQGLIAESSSTLTQNQANFSYTLPEKFPLLAADSTQIRCVLENLLINALKHNPPGLNLKLQITVEEKMLRCTLQDDGVGMSQEQQNSLFKLYIRGLHTKHLTGIGLGLYQCRCIIQAHGGEIGVISNPGEGSTFWFTLPFVLPNYLESQQLVSNNA